MSTHPQPSAESARKPVTLPHLREMRASGEPITMLTCYDASFAKLLDAQGVDCVLVGDSLGMVVQGLDSTLPVTLEEVAYHTRCVARGLQAAWLIADMPFGSYQESPQVAYRNAVTLMIATAPKLAAFAMSIRLLVEGLLPLAIDWQQMLGVLAVASLLLGNMIAVVQTNLKRMLAYSTIGQVGFILLGLMAGVSGGTALGAANAYSSAMFYVITYVLTTLVSFGIILLLSREGFESEEIVDLAGLNQRSPLYAGIMAVCLFSLAGIPPLVGFQAKLSVLQALISAGSAVHVGIAVFAVMMSLIGAYAYLRVVKVMYFDEPTMDAPIRAPWDMRAVLSVNGAMLLILGVVPGALMTLCARAVVQMLGT